MDFVTIIYSMILIMLACNMFEQAASYLGRNLSAGARGAIIDACGSSLPEFFVTLMFVFTGKAELILAGIAVTAGSAVFNAVLIPAFSIWNAKDKFGNKIKSFKINRNVIYRDGFYLLLIEGMLIYFLGKPFFTIEMVASLIVAYIIYAAHVMWDSYKSNEENEYEFKTLGSESKFEALARLDMNNILFKDKPLNFSKAAFLLTFSIAIVGYACHLLAGGIENISVMIGIPVFFVSAILAAAATSVPDTLLSIKSAKRGDYDDSVSNAVGSNIFDITIALGVPLLIYMIFSGKTSLPIEQSGGLLALRYFVLGTSAVVVGTLAALANNITKKVAVSFFTIYGIWMAYIIYEACK